MKNIHYLYLSRELHLQEHMYSCIKLESAMQSHAALNMYVKYSKPWSVLTCTSLAPLISAEVHRLYVSNFGSVDLMCA